MDNLLDNRSSSLEDCLLILDRMLRMEDEDGGGEETAYEVGETDGRQSCLDITLDDTMDSSVPLQATGSTDPPALCL